MRPPPAGVAARSEDDEAGMQLAGTMIGATGVYTFSGVVQRDAGGRFVAVARVFDHPDPSLSLPSGTTPRHVVEVEGGSLKTPSSCSRIISPPGSGRWNGCDGTPRTGARRAAMI
jgi:hypothetical protein